MSHILSDIYIGNFSQSQAFGERPDIYMARFGIRGHNGIDIGCPSMTPILSTSDGIILELGFDSGGYGNYVKVLHDGFFSLYAHLNDIAVHKGDKVVSGQLIAHSNNSGMSEAPHLHFGVALCDSAGNKLERDNGYSGYKDPNSEPFVWNIKNLTAPILPDNGAGQPIKVDPLDYTNIVSKSSSHDVIIGFLLNNGLNNYLSAKGEKLIDLSFRPADPENGKRIVSFLADLLQEVKTLDHDNQELRLVLEQVKQPPLSPAPVASSDVVGAVSQATDLNKTFFITTILNAVKNFVFVPKI